MTHETARQDVPRVRIRGARAGLQRRPDPEPVPDRARQDPAEPVVGDVRAASAPARDGYQAGAPARPVAVPQGLRRLTRLGPGRALRGAGAPSEPPTAAVT